MVRIAVWGVGLAGLLLCGCVSNPPKTFAQPDDYVAMRDMVIESQFPSVQLTVENLEAEARKCVPPLGSSKGTAQLAAKLPLPDNTVTALGHVSFASQFLVARSTGYCLRQSAARFPIVAAEAFFETANPQGVPADVLDGWYKQMARELATVGAVKVAYALPNGNAFVVRYRFGRERGATEHLYYDMDFKKAGTWESDAYAFTFRHPGFTTIGHTKRKDVGQKPNLISHRR